MMRSGRITDLKSKQLVSTAPSAASPPTAMKSLSSRDAKGSQNINSAGAKSLTFSRQKMLGVLLKWEMN
jgi:hypothetical protein